MSDQAKHKSAGNGGQQPRPSQAGNENKRSSTMAGGNRAALPINVVRDDPDTGTRKDDGKKK